MDDPLTLLLVLGSSVIAVSLVVAMNAFLGGWTPARFATLDEAAHAIMTDVLGFRPGEGALSADRRAALVLEADRSRLGLALARGDRAVVRALRSGELASAAREGARLILTLNDFTLPRAVIDFDSEVQARVWEATASDYIAAQGGVRAEPA